MVVTCIQVAAASYSACAHVDIRAYSLLFPSKETNMATLMEASCCDSIYSRRETCNCRLAYVVRDVCATLLHGVEQVILNTQFIYHTFACIPMIQPLSCIARRFEGKKDCSGLSPMPNRLYKEPFPWPYGRYYVQSKQESGLPLYRRLD